jgi:hypothetical protein
MFIHCGLPSPLEIPIIAQEREQSLKCFGLHVINAYDKGNGYEEHKKKDGHELSFTKHILAELILPKCHNQNMIIH